MRFAEGGRGALARCRGEGGSPGTGLGYPWMVAGMDTGRQWIREYGCRLAASGASESR